MTYTLVITHPDGTVTQDYATGNTARTALAAAVGLARSYELDGCTVSVRRAAGR